jgi:hypothetical protein
MTNRSGIAQLTSLRDELNTLINHVVASDEALPSLSSLDSPVSPPTLSVLRATAATRELLALLQGSTVVFEKALSVRLLSMFPLLRGFADLFSDSSTSHLL